MICPICQVGTMVKGVCNWCGAPTQVKPEPYVTFKRTGIYVDLPRYFQSPAGKAALERLAKVNPVLIFD